MKLKTEKDVKKAINTELKKFGDDICYYMPPASAYGRAGVHDFVGCVLGKFFTIEAKSPLRGLKGLSALQCKFKCDVEKAGGLSCVVWDYPSLATTVAKLCCIKKQALQELKQ